MKEEVIKLLKDKKVLTMDDIEFAYKMGYYDGRTDLLVEQINKAINNENKRK